MKSLAALLLFLLVVLTGTRAQETPPERYALALQFNRGDVATAFRSWPWVVEVIAAYGDETGAAVSLDPAAAQLTVRDAAGKIVTWPWQRVTAPAAAVILDPARPAATLRWMLSAEQTAALAVGAYELGATWGEESSPALRVTVGSAPATLTPAQEFQRSQLAQDAAPGPATAAQALGALETVLAQQPDSVALWTEKAVLLKEAGRIDEAIRAIAEALALFARQNPRSPRPPVLLLRIQNELMRLKIAAVVAQRGRPPAGAGSSPGTLPPVTPALVPPTAPAAAVPPGVASAPSVSSVPISVASALDERAQVELVPATALTDGEIIAEPNGQWASAARASSQYGAEAYSAARATGQPNVRQAGNDPEAWCPAEQDAGTAWLELTFARPVHATAFRVRQNQTPGAISRVEAIDAAGGVHLWWTGRDPFQPPRVRDIAWFMLRRPKTDYAVVRVKVTFDLTAVSGWKEIDAVQLVGEL